MDIHHPEKTVWSDQDFDVMGWHDTTVWSIVADSDKFEFLVDIDYIFNWVQPSQGEIYFKFWISPATMVFENASDVRLEIESQQGCIEVMELRRDRVGPSPNGKFTQYKFTFVCRQGRIEIQATSFQMYVRRAPVLLKHQSYSLAGRNGVSFSRTYSVDK